MANRKVLINRHTSGNTVPVAADMYKGEIAVQHKAGEEILWTKNNDDVMVPFISCAQTMTMINNAITAADVTYDVKAAEGDAHVKVAAGGDEKAKVFTVSSKDVQGKAAFDAYSAATDATIKNNYNTLSGAIDDVLEMLITAVTGEGVIEVEPDRSGATGYNIKHKEAPDAVATGFNKLATDAYGHVTAATAVAASDIKALGFEDSAWTEQKITDAIEALDSSISASAGKYFTALAIEDGKLKVKEEADVPVLEVESAGTGNVVEAITVNGHKISYTTTSVATSHDIEELSAATKSFSAGTYSEFNSVFTAIQAMDKAASAEDGKVVTTVSEVDGVVSETKANVKDLQLGGYSKDTTATGDIASTDTINAALSKLENKANANAISNADGSINVTTGATGTDINVNIKSGEKVLAKDGNAGLYTDLDLVKITTGLPATVKERYQLLATNDSQIGVDIDIAKDSHIVSIRYITDSADTHYQNLEYKYLDVEGTEQTEYVDVSSLVLEAEFASGVTVTNHVAHGVVDPTSELFLTVGGAGFKLSGVQDAIDSAIEALDVTNDAAVAGQYVAAIEETDGLVAVKTRANVSEAVLNNYAKGTDATAVAATDTVNQAISKLENQIDKAKDAATTKVVEGTDEGNNMTIVPTTGDDSSVTYTVNLTDVASKAALDAEITARKAVDGQTGQTYAANANTNYITGATSLNDADVKLDAALKAVSDKVDAAKVTEGSSVENFVTLALDTATTAGTTALTINDSALKTKIDEINSAITAETKARQDAIADLDSTAQTSGNGYFLTSVQLADGKITAATQSDKVNSATTAELADTAASADKVANALSVSGYSDSSASTLNTAIAYDGHEAKSLTFGTNGNAGLKSMSMTSAGVVDVEVIDCGEY